MGVERRTISKSEKPNLETLVHKHSNREKRISRLCYHRLALRELSSLILVLLSVALVALANLESSHSFEFPPAISTSAHINLNLLMISAGLRKIHLSSSLSKALLSPHRQAACTALSLQKQGRSSHHGASFITTPPRRRNSNTVRLFATNSFSENDCAEALSRTPLGVESASHLLDGLDVYTIYSNDQKKHPISLYGIHSKHESDEFQSVGKHRRPILLLHGRTWSSVPVYHLLGGKQNRQSCDGEDISDGSQKSRSLMESLYKQGLQPYALDFRGFGGTPSDDTDSVTPNTCVCDVGYALDFISRKHARSDSDAGEHHCHLPTLLGWSQGALVAQLFAQKNPHLISKLILYGSIYDPLLSYPPMPLYVNGTDAASEERVKNTFNAAIEDFTIEGSIPPEPATKFAQAALLSDPYKARWTNLSQFNNCDPARISVPTLIVAGDQDPYAPMRVQVALFENLGRGADRTWSIIADADHAVHLLDDGRDRFINIVTSFVENSKKGETLD